MQKATHQGISSKKIKKVAVIGAGVMGQGIASHMINAGLSCILLDRPSDKKDRNQYSRGALEKIKKQKPSLIFSKDDVARIKIGNIEDDISLLKDCDVIIEAIIEKADLKRELFKTIEPHLGENTIVASNTSGLSLVDMLDGVSEQFKERFMVMHFFNPVRYLHLLELIPCEKTKPEYVNMIKEFGERCLGKGVVFGKDTVNFIANRVGVYAMLETINEVVNGDYTIEEVDAIFGPKLGRPKSAVFRTADVVGLDTFIHVANNCYENLSADECRSVFKIPSFLEKMVEKNWLGQKSGQGFYKKEGKTIYALDPKSLTYHEKQKPHFESLGKIKNLNTLSEKYSAMARGEDKASELFFKLMAKTFVYAANRLHEIADEIYEIDNALEWGFGWEMGPFKAMDAIGLEYAIDRMKKLGITPPDWVKKMLKENRHSFYSSGNSQKQYVYNPKTTDQKEIPKDEREIKLELLKTNAGNIVKETDAYSLLDANNGALVVEFHTKMNAIDQEILKGINEGIDHCENGDFEALVLANDGANFSVGANLLLMYMSATQQMWDDIESMIVLFQNTAKRLKYSKIPTVAAPFQLTLGGGAELSLWCDRIHAHAETYMGLVEVGVGLIPGGGGNIEMIARTLENTPDNNSFVIEPFLMRALETVAMAKVATSVKEAKALTYFSAQDEFSMNRRFLLHDACQTAVAMARADYRPSFERQYRLPGKSAYATFDMGLRTYFEGGFISEHDYKIAKKIARIMTGGDTTMNQKVSEQHLLDLERESFMSLVSEEKTLARIAYMLENNKPLRN